MGTSTYITDVDSDQVLVESESERQGQTYKAVTVLGACSVVAVILSLFVREDLRRVNYDKNASSVSATIN